MQCKNFCTADSYEMNSLFQFLKAGGFEPCKYRNVIHSNSSKGQVFFFSYGCVVFWGLNDEEINNILKKLKKYHIGEAYNKISDAYFISEGEKTKIEQNKIYLAQNDKIMERLAISYALAQSMKLSVFEEKVEHTIRGTEEIPRSLALNGRIPLTEKEIAKKMGQLFLERSSINLHSDILDTPELFWENPALEPIYLITAKDQDIKQRVDILNKRLNLLHELFQMLSEIFHSRHSSILEIIIIVLISIEIILTISFKLVN